MDPRHANGGVFLGLDGVVIKSHGGTDALGYAGAIEIGYEMVRHRLLDRIRETLMLADEDRAPIGSLAASNRALGPD
jgi:glycerol-3-phosphate acyltransferase PlsX